MKALKHLEKIYNNKIFYEKVSPRVYCSVLWIMILVRYYGSLKYSYFIPFKIMYQSYKSVQLFLKSRICIMQVLLYSMF
jgi:hypothetical protein